MIVQIEQELAKAYFARGGENAALRQAAQARTWGTIPVDSDILTEADADLIIKAAKSNPELTAKREQRRHIRTLKSLVELRRAKGKPIIKLEAMAEALRMTLMPLKNHWVFREVDGWMLPYYVEEISFHPREVRHGSVLEAHIRIVLRACARGANISDHETVRREALGGGCTPQELLARLGMFPETDELVAGYEADVARHKKFAKMAGEQFVATGDGVSGPCDYKDEDATYSRWSRSRIKLTAQGEPGRVVMDDEVGFGVDDEGRRRSSSLGCSQALWVKAKSNNDREVAEEEGEIVIPPLHPTVNVFSMATHEFVVTHVNNLEPYQYSPALADKLVLPASHRELINVMLGASGEQAHDIVRGKSGGTIILCSGIPGTGKTLTAEVYSEVAARPLYTVQCSQLGISPDSLETELGRVLHRAERWRAVLLIDEADVYIHDRGDSVTQNAIVGVFLRMLEYYSGVLFLTTNRATVVDDAVASRCIAHISYGVPDNDADKARIWRVLSDQYGLKLTDKFIGGLVDRHGQLTGRNVKQLCRLAAAMQKTRKVDMELFDWLLQYQDVVQ